MCVCVLKKEGYICVFSNNCSLLLPLQVFLFCCFSVHVFSRKDQQPPSHNEPTLRSILGESMPDVVMCIEG